VGKGMTTDGKNTLQAELGAMLAVWMSQRKELPPAETQERSCVSTD